MTIDLTRRAMLGVIPALGMAGPAFAQQDPEPPVGNAAPDGVIDFLPGAWVDAYGRPTAKVMVNGSGPYSFMVDTGSSATVLAERHVLALGAPIVGMATVAGTTGVSEVQVAQIDKLQSGVVAKSNLRVAVLKDQSIPTIDGILGGDVFAGRRLVFNIREKMVRVENTRRTIRTSTTVNMRVRNGLLAEVEGRVGSVDAKLMLDTGAESCIANLALSEALRRKHPRQTRIDNVRIYGVTGHELVGQYINLPRVNLKAFTVDDAGCVAADAPIFDIWGLKDEPAMIVGVSLLALLDSFSIDYGARVFDATLLSELIARNSVAFG